MQLYFEKINLYGSDGCALVNKLSLGQFLRINTFFSQFINLKQKGSIVEHIEDFQKLNIRVTDIPEEHMIDVFIGL